MNIDLELLNKQIDLVEYHIVRDDLDSDDVDLFDGLTELLYTIENKIRAEEPITLNLASSPSGSILNAIDDI